MIGVAENTIASVDQDVEERDSLSAGPGLLANPPASTLLSSDGTCCLGRHLSTSLLPHTEPRRFEKFRDPVIWQARNWELYPDSVPLPQLREADLGETCRSRPTQDTALTPQSTLFQDPRVSLLCGFPEAPLSPCWMSGRRCMRISVITSNFDAVTDADFDRIGAANPWSGSAMTSSTGRPST